MENAITDLRIDNFKSIKGIRIQPKRINLFIGKPNVGKSNVLEALSLLNAPGHANGAEFLKDIIRFNELRDLFFEKQTEESIYVSSNLGHAHIFSFQNSEAFLFEILKGYPEFVDKGPDNSFKQKVNNHVRTIQEVENNFINNVGGEATKKHLDELKSSLVQIHLHRNNKNPEHTSFLPVLKYDFKSLSNHHVDFNKYLLPPFGQNLYNLLLSNRELHKSIGPFFKEYEQQLLIRTQDRSLEVQRIRDGISVSYSYSMIADTLQRIIFYLSAIETNQNSVLLFEEPEAHAFPPYTTDLAHRIVNSKNNQFFITTHSPYLFDIIVERTPIEELGVFVCYFDDYQTKIKALSAEEIKEAISDSVDVFFNLDRYTSHASV